MNMCISGNSATMFANDVELLPVEDAQKTRTPHSLRKDTEAAAIRSFVVPVFRTDSSLRNRFGSPSFLPNRAACLHGVYGILICTRFLGSSIGKRSKKRHSEFAESYRCDDSV